MLKYLDKIKVLSETATNGQECLDMVFSKEPGYYSLIIVSIPTSTRKISLKLTLIVVRYPNASEERLRYVP